MSAAVVSDVNGKINHYKRQAVLKALNKDHEKTQKTQLKQINNYGI